MGSRMGKFMCLDGVVFAGKQIPSGLEYVHDEGGIFLLECIER